jgi:hypothetical protein
LICEIILVFKLVFKLDIEMILKEVCL